MDMHNITRFQIIFQIIYFPKYLYKIYNSISQNVMSDIQSIQVYSGFEQNRRHFRRSPCNPGIHNPDSISHHKGNLQPVAIGAEIIDRLSYHFHEYLVFNTGHQMQFITTYHIFEMGYTTPWSFPG